MSYSICQILLHRLWHYSKGADEYSRFFFGGGRRLDFWGWWYASGFMGI